MARKPSFIEKDRFGCEIPNSIFEDSQSIRDDLMLDSISEVIRRGLDLYFDFWDKQKRQEPIATRDKMTRIELVKDPEIDHTGGLRRLNLEFHPSRHKKVEALAEEQSKPKVAIICKGILLVKTLKEALNQGGEVGYMVDHDFRPVMYELLFPLYNTSLLSR